MDKYEISLWEDFNDTTSSGKTFLNERKIAIIGSDTMNAQARALEPNLVEDINGTTTFTFKMYYTYTDPVTGEKYNNPYGQYLINERKVKVYWKNKWYDLVIKKCQEDSSKKLITYTCKDLFINELSKQGYSLEFNSELQNNIGTAAELATEVLKDSTWQYDATHSQRIIQRSEGPVYEVSVLNAFTATKQSPNGDTSVTIPKNARVLVFYDSIVSVMESGGTNVPTQFLYSSTGYITDVNNMLVINGDCYNINLNWTKTGQILYGKSGNTAIFNIDMSLGVSTQYRAERLIKAIKTEYDPLLDRYVELYKTSTGQEVYKIETTEYTDPLAVVNLVVNPKEFSNVSGWIGRVSTWGIFPKFTSSTTIASYSPISYLLITSGDTYNTALQSNISYFTPTANEIKNGKLGGIQKGDKFIFRVKAKTNSSSAPGSYVNTNGAIVGNVYKYNTSYAKTGTAIFSRSNVTYTNNWMEYTLTCTTSVSAAHLNEYGLFITSNNSYWIEDIQFFRYMEGVTSYAVGAQKQRMNPGEVNLQSIANPVYKYYLKNNTAKTADELTYLYVGNTDTSEYIPQYTNYDKYGTIEEKESNRFNILQSIAETFQAWVRFRIDHESNGAIKFINGVPQKFVYFLEEIGDDTGISFEYGIDLKTISRSIDSDKLATKVIVNPNSNKFAPNGFCSIARSEQNYSKENFILNLDYYTQQNLLNKSDLDRDLYSTSSNSIGYYYYLHSYNREYDTITDTLTTKNLDLIKQEAQKEVYEQYLLAARQELGNIESDLERLAGVTTWSQVQDYARAHTSNEKVQSLLNVHGSTQAEINDYTNSITQITSAISILKSYITSLQNRQAVLLSLISNKHKQFNDKYSAYIMEGTWQDEDYVDADKYFLDGLTVAYTSSRPQLAYDINVLRISSLEEYSSKVFNLGDICYMQDREFFGYLSDKITPYKEKILVSKVSSYFDQPEKDIITVQNYKTRFDDLFQRIAATTQSLSYAEGSFARAADSVNTDGSVSFTALQDTFDQNAELVINSSNQNVIWDNTGITVTNKYNSGDKTKIIAGGIFVTNDGGQTWKNAVRGDGISTDLLTAGKINTSEIFVFDGNAPSFRWDSYGLTAYAYSGSTVNFGKFVRHDRYGFYGYNGNGDFRPANENAIWSNAKFGMTWKGFFLKGGASNSTHFQISDDGEGINFVLSNSNSNSGLYISANSSGTTFKLNGGASTGLSITSDSSGTSFLLYGSKDGNSLKISSNASGVAFEMSGSKNGSGLEITSNATTTSFKMTNKNNNAGIEISTANDIVVTDANNRKRIQIGRINGSSSNYGFQLQDENNNVIFTANSSGANIAGWTINNTSLYKTVGSSEIGFYSGGKQATVQGVSGTYYILAGSGFGVMSNGNIYANGGKIGGWTIESNRLSSTSGNAYLYLNSDGTIQGRTSDAANWTVGRDGTFYFTSTGTSSVTSQIILGKTTINNTSLTTESLNAKGGSIGGWTINASTLTGGNLTIDSTGNIKCVSGGETKWELQNNGNITAKYGTIAGWTITSSGFYNATTDTYLNANSGSGTYGISTSSINASGGYIAGCSFNGSTITGSNWSLGSGSSSIGGWTINSSSLSGGTVQLSSSGNGSISFGNGSVSIAAGGNADLRIWNNLTVENWLAVGGTLNVSDYIKTLEYLQINNQKLDDDDISGLHGWKKQDGSYYSPNEVRVAGINSVTGWVTSRDGEWYQTQDEGKKQDITVRAYGTDLNGTHINITGNGSINVDKIYNDGKSAGENEFSGPYTKRIYSYNYVGTNKGNYEYNGYTDFTYYTKD